MTRYMIWNKFTNQTVPSVFDSLDTAVSVLKPLVPNLKNLVEAICVTKGWNHYYTEWEAQ